MKVWVRSIDFHSLVPNDGLQPKLRLPVKLDEGRFSFGIHQPERMNSKALHETKRSRDCTIRHDPHHHMHALGRQRNEIPGIVVRCLRLREPSVWFGLEGMYHIGELDRILNEEDWH